MDRLVRTQQNRPYCNAIASRYLGINDNGIKLFVYAFAGFCAALAGMISAADIQGSDANNAGLWLELDAILAVVIGGTSLMGGRFNLALSLVGILIIQGVNTGILLSGYQPQWNQIVKAMVVLAVLVMQSPALNHLFQRGSRHV